MEEKVRAVLKRLTDESRLEEEKDISHDERMLAITEDTGKFFNLIIKAAKYKEILEIGTSVGYSTIWLAEAAAVHGGRVTTIEYSTRKIQRARKNFLEAGLSNINVIQGSAIDVLTTLSQSVRKKERIEFDFVFIDADKENVAEYVDRALEMTRKGGVIAVDNMLFPERFRSMMKKLHEYLEHKKGIQNVTIPIGNGEELVFKI